LSSKVLLIIAGIVGAVALRAHATPQAVAPDPATIESAVRSVADVFAREYFDIQLSKRVADELHHRLAAGRYADAASPADLAQRLTRDVFELTQDKHVVVAVARPRVPGGGGGSEKRDVPTTAGFRRSEIIAGNIGVLDMAFFMRPIEHRDALAAAMQTLQPADALIIDLRENGGGSPGTVALLLGYLLDSASQPLFEIVHRDGSKDSYTSEATPPLTRNARRPIYVLTSPRTFSAGEGLAFILQERKRAVVIGEVTAGAANPGRSYPAGTLFEITVPNGRVVTAITKRNWEGSGVTPDIIVPAADAFRVAHLRGLDDVIAATVDPTRRKELQGIRANLAKR
jgi:C-terminal processing protease CtpA/Prc